MTLHSTQKTWVAVVVSVFSFGLLVLSNSNCHALAPHTHRHRHSSPSLRLTLPQTKTTTTPHSQDTSHPNTGTVLSRRWMLLAIPKTTVTAIVAATAIASSTCFLPLPVNAITGSQDGFLPDLPPEASRSYLQYRIGMQTSMDYYLWELQDLVAHPEDWGDVGQLFQASSGRGAQGQPNRIERQFVNPMRILGLSMPPEVADEMRDAQFAFERAMATITKATAGVRRDLPIELDPKNVIMAKQGWEDGRLALNSFLTILNTATGLKEMRLIPPPGPNQTAEYGRSQRKYLELTKKTKLCQNRGGPALSQAWGQLMVSGYLQDSCGIPDLDLYFYQ